MGLSLKLYNIMSCVIAETGIRWVRKEQLPALYGESGTVSQRVSVGTGAQWISSFVRGKGHEGSLQRCRALAGLVGSEAAETFNMVRRWFEMRLERGDGPRGEVD